MRTLLIRPGAIGDCIVSLPALEHCRSSYTEVWVPTPVVPLIRFADRVEAISRTGLDLVGLQDSPRTFARLGEFDRIVSWYGTRTATFREAVRGLPFTFLPALPPADCPCHAIDFFARQVGAPDGLIPRIPVPAVPRRDEVVVHPFSGSPRKNVPLDFFERLAAASPWPVTWIAGPDEQCDGAKKIEDLYELAGWIAGCRLYIGNDSGISHLSAAVGVPVTAYFRVTDPRIWSPRPSHVRLFINETGNCADSGVFLPDSSCRQED